ncbi:sigma-70 family RNA polymerase sigma factor [Ktedonospora formicarum]|uniref:DNA-directed RNA polymerase sigma-70 factor n=1 Tax=Ktedonospora formicarum TaxID=2778364 RepID=A0A8J3MUY0_9CHLR|nr:sigma-70 family RNA polymerase sigma factor [Ktedonospora formicarum]GHO45890.1 DNA-directed RNA polymerase sigma-70 factor [Ktedonospora formicarum]
MKNTHNWLVTQFEAERPRLRAIAYRMLGSLTEAEDAVQESWLNLSSSDTSTVSNLSGWLTTVVARVCLNMLRTRKSRREDSLEASEPEAVTGDKREVNPEQEMELADSVGLALLVVLDQLAPAERLAFVLHDIFAVSFDEIAPIVERSEAATRQLASRARRRVRGKASMQDADIATSRDVVEAFLAAAREGSFEALLAVLDPNIVVRFDSQDVPVGAPREMHGAAVVAKMLVEHSQIFRACQVALVNGFVGIVVAPYARLIAVGDLLIKDGKITIFTAILDPVRLRQLHLAVLND